MIGVWRPSVADGGLANGAAVGELALQAELDLLRVPSGAKGVDAGHDRVVPVLERAAYVLASMAGASPASIRLSARMALTSFLWSHGAVRVQPPEIPVCPRGGLYSNVIAEDCSAAQRHLCDVLIATPILVLCNSSILPSTIFGTQSET